MSRDSSTEYELAGLALRLSIKASLVLFYVSCFVAVHLTVGVLRAQTAGEQGASGPSDATGEGIFVGVVAGVLWALGATVTLGLATQAAAGWIAGLVMGLPVAAVVGWQAGAWQAALAWSRVRGSSFLGTWRGGRFLVSRPYTVTPLERHKHLVCCGATGAGKSTLVRNLILQDLRSGAGVCVIDPKDDLIDKLLGHIPDARVEDVIFFDAADTERPLGLNPFAGIPVEQRSLAASELIAVFRRYFVDAWGARLEHVLRNVVLCLLEVPGATLADVPRLLLDRSYVDWAIRHVTNPAVREFFLVEYEEVLRRRSDAIEPILNKVGPWLSYPELRNIISQPESAFDLRRVMDEGKVLLVRIPQGVFGEDVSNLLGALIVARVQLAAQSRVGVPAERRRPFYLYVDEFQNFATTSFAKILTEARAFNLGLVCINQYPEQLNRELQLALVKNAATFVEAVHRRGTYLLDVTRQEDLREKKPPVYVVTPPPPLPEGDAWKAALVRKTSRERYGRPVGDDPANAVLLTGDVADNEQAVPAWGRDLDEE